MSPIFLSPYLYFTHPHYHAYLPYVSTRFLLSQWPIHLAASHYRSDLTGPSHPGACYFSVLSRDSPPATRLLSTYLNTQGTILTTQLTQKQSYLPTLSWWPRIEIIQSGRIREEMFIKCNWFLLPRYQWENSKIHWNVYPWFFSSVLSGLKVMCFLLHASLCLPWLSLREPETSDALGGGEVTVWPNAHRSQFPKAWHRWWCQVCLASLPPLLLGPLAAPVPSLLHPFQWPCSSHRIIGEAGSNSIKCVKVTAVSHFL